jgi:hypothetical protein
MPPVNAFIREEELPSEVSYPLAMAFCPGCGLVQLEDVVPPEKLFRHYHHLSSASQGNVAHLAAVAERVAAFKRLGPGSQVLEIGSNDGTLLKAIAKTGARVLGIDPARNVAEMAIADGVPTIAEFFSSTLAKNVVAEHGLFDMAIGLNVLPHTPVFMDVLRGFRTLLKEDGIVVIEGVYIYETLFEGDFDTVYHEHVFCFSLNSLDSALTRAGLRGVHVELIPTQGGSMRVFACRNDVSTPPSAEYRELLAKERARGVMDVASYAVIGEHIREITESLRTAVADLTRKYGKLAALGAPARGVVLLNTCGFGRDEIAYVIDDTPLKQGRLMPGTHIPVMGWDHLEKEPAQAFILLSWNYKRDMLQKLKERVPRGKVLVPLPKVTIEDL